MITILIASTTTKSTRNAESVLFDNLHTIEHFITSEIGILLHIFSNRIILGDVTLTTKMLLRLQVNRFERVLEKS